MPQQKVVLVVIGVVAVFLACSVDDVDTRDFDQTCRSDDDCVLVEELLASGADCAISCPRNGINKADKARYEAKLKEERGGCRSISEPSCVALSPACRAERCVAIGEDGGVP